MLKKEHEYETTIESNFYQNDLNSFNPQKPSNNQNTILHIKMKIIQV